MTTTRTAITNALLEQLEDEPTVILTMECASQEDADRLYAVVAEGMRRGDLTLKAGKPVEVEEGISGRVQ